MLIESIDRLIRATCSLQSRLMVVNDDGRIECHPFCLRAATESVRLTPSSQPGAHTAPHRSGDNP